MRPLRPGEQHIPQQVPIGEASPPREGDLPLRQAFARRGVEIDRLTRERNEARHLARHWRLCAWAIAVICLVWIVLFGFVVFGGQ